MTTLVADLSAATSRARAALPVYGDRRRDALVRQRVKDAERSLGLLQQARDEQASIVEMIGGQLPIQTKLGELIIKRGTSAGRLRGGQRSGRGWPGLGCWALAAT